MLRAAGIYVHPWRREIKHPSLSPPLPFPSKHTHVQQRRSHSNHRLICCLWTNEMTGRKKKNQRDKGHFTLSLSSPLPLLAEREILRCWKKIVFLERKGREETMSFACFRIIMRCIREGEEGRNCRLPQSLPSILGCEESCTGRKRKGTLGSL